MRKKLLVMMLTVCMVIGMMPMSGMAQEAPESGKTVIKIKEGSDTIADKIASMGEINRTIYRIDVEIQKDYTLTEADIRALSQTHKNFTVIVRAHTLTMEKVDPTDDGLREVAVEVYPGARIIYAGEEIIGSEQAIMAIRSGKVLVHKGRDFDPSRDYAILEQVFWIPVPPVELVIQKEYEGIMINPYEDSPFFDYRSGTGTISLVIKSDFKLKNEDFFYKFGDDPVDLSVNVEDGGILNVDNKRKFKEEPHYPVSLIDRKFDHFDEELEDIMLYRSISIKGSGKVTFTNPITEKQKEALFVSDVKTTDGGKTWILAEQGGQGAEDQKPEQPKPQQPASSGSTGSQSSVRPDSSSKTDTKRSDDKKAEDKKAEEKKQDNKIDKATEQTATVAEKVSTKLTIGDKKYTALIDGVTVEKTMDVAPKIHQGRTVLPARMISELLGVGVRYDAKSKTASFTYGENNKVELTLGQKFMTVNGQKVELSAEVLNENGRILLPLTDIQKAFADLGLKATVGWDAMTRSITIDK